MGGRGGGRTTRPTEPRTNVFRVNLIIITIIIIIIITIMITMIIIFIIIIIVSIIMRLPPQPSQSHSRQLSHAASQQQFS